MPGSEAPPATRVLLAGTFEPEFARNRVITGLLRRAGFDVAILQRDLWGRDRYALVDQPKLKLALRATRAYLSLIRALSFNANADAIVVLYPGYFDAPLIGAIARMRRIPVIFDIFISLHDTVVGDRGLRKPGSPMARATAFADKLACRSAQLVLADTPSDAAFFAELTGIERGRFRTLWLGAREDVFRPVTGVVVDSRLVLFHGTFIPLQGLETVVRAAKLLEPEGVRFRLVGDGQERAAIERLVRALDARNVELTGLLPITALPREIASAAVCLGIFGTTSKAARVVPNKVFECIAVGRPVVTADTPAIRSAFDDELVLVPPGDAAALASALSELLATPERLQALAEAAHARFVRDYSEEALSRTLAAYVDEVVKPGSGGAGLRRRGRRSSTVRS